MVRSRKKLFRGRFDNQLEEMHIFLFFISGGENPVKLVMARQQLLPY